MGLTVFTVLAGTVDGVPVRISGLRLMKVIDVCDPSVSGSPRYYYYSHAIPPTADRSALWIGDVPKVGSLALADSVEAWPYDPMAAVRKLEKSIEELLG